MNKTDPHKFMAIASKSHSVIAGEMADDIKEVIYKYSERVPLALAVGVLRIVENEILENSN